MKGDEEKCLQAGMDAYLAKPIHPHQFYDLLRRFCPPDDTAVDRETDLVATSGRISA
jgi:CheY-like chemotaxis protein